MWPPIKLPKTIAKFLYGGFISIFGAPARLLSERGTSFTSSIIWELCEILGVQWLQTMPYHPQANGAGREIAPDDYAHDWEAGRRQESWLAITFGWNSAHAYNATWSAVTRYSPHYLMFGRWPRLPVDFVFPTVGSSKAPTREASTRKVDTYVASVRDQLRSALREVQAQSTAEACWQKWYHGQKVGTVNLKPGNLVLVKAEAWKGKRKIKDRWDEETWEVSRQIVTDVPSYKVMNQHRQSQVLHWNWLLLVASEVGIPLCMGNHHTQYRCTSPTPCKTTSLGDDKMMTPQEQNGQAVTQRPTRRASQGWKIGKLWLGSWMSTGASTEDGWRPQLRWFGCWTPEEHVCKAEGRRLYPLMLADSEPKEECCHSLNWVMAGKAKIQMGGVKWVSSPMSEWRMRSLLPWCMKYYPPTERNLSWGATLYPTERPNQQY